MTLVTPTLEEIVQRTRGHFRAQLPQSDAWLWPNNLAVSSKVYGGTAFELYETLHWVYRQKFVTTASDENVERHGEQYGIARQPVSKASGIATITGTAGTDVPTGTVLQRSDGQQYAVTTMATVAANGQASASIEAVVPGPDGNSVAATPLTITPSITNIDDTAVVNADGLGGGAPRETIDSLKARILFRLQNPPHGGAAHDYIAWARSIPGVTRAWVVPLKNGPGTVQVYFLMDDSYPCGIPLASDVSTVQGYIDTVRPVTAQVTVSAPVADPINININELNSRAAVVREAINAELKHMFRTRVNPGLPDALTTLRYSWIGEAISRGEGEVYHTLKAPVTDITSAVGTIPVLGDITYGL